MIGRIGRTANGHEYADGLIDIPTQEEILLKNLKNKSYRDYMLKVIGINSILDSYETINKIKSEQNDFYEEDSYFYTKKTFSLENIQSGLGDCNFYYKLNKDGFRSKNFDEFDQNNTNFLFAGCSITYGIGLPEGLTWPDFFSKKVSDSQNNFDFYNISLPGASIFLNFKNILAFIKSVGKPDYILMIVPETTRNLHWDVESKKFANALITSQQRQVDINYKKQYVQENNLMFNIVYLQTLEYICSILGIKLIWTSWNSISSDIYKQFEFNNFFEIDKDHPLYVFQPRIFDGYYNFLSRLFKINYEESLKKINDFNINNFPFWEVARDERHPGVCFSEIYSDSFLKEFKKYIDLH